jgi:16S rRNA (guanine527-N7)-methyltransferase
MADLDILIAGARALGLELSATQLDQFSRYRAGLAAWNQRMNLTSASALADAERVLFLDSLSLVPVIRRQPSPSRLIDIGAGAGFPGVALKIVMPDTAVVLVEATGKKAEFLSWLVDDLGLDGVDVVAMRAEEIARRPGLREMFDVATARAVGPLPVVLELTLPFCRMGGIVVAPRGRDAGAGAEAARKAAHILGGWVRDVEWFDTLDDAHATGIVVVDKVAATPENYPRRTGVPRKNPLA